MVKNNKTILLIIDPQNDFHAGGSLAVQGALLDSTKIAKMIMNKADMFDEIIVSLDSHHRNHIAHSVFWIDATGKNPISYTEIKNKDVGIKWWPRNSKHLEWCKEYTRRLEEGGKFVLTIWPEHCLVSYIYYPFI